MRAFLENVDGINVAMVCAVADWNQMLTICIYFEISGRHRTFKHTPQTPHTAQTPRINLRCCLAANIFYYKPSITQIFHSRVGWSVSKAFYNVGVLDTHKRALA